MKQIDLLFTTISITTIIAVLIISLGFQNTFAQNFEIDVEKRETPFSDNGLFSSFYDIKGVTF